MSEPEQPDRWGRTTQAVDRDTVPTKRDVGDVATPVIERDTSPFDPPRHDRFEERGELGRGGMGRVFEAHDTALDRAVAIKQSLTDDDAMVARFEREVRITAKLQHPSIVPVLDAGRDEHGRPYYVMRKIEGRPLASMVGETTTVPERIALVARVMGAIDATAYAHARGIIHRDIKPWNVLLGPFGEALLIDWGIARELDQAELDAIPPSRRSADGLTRIGASLGTPGFMAPEQERGEALDRRADVYALGATLAHTLLADVPKPRARDDGSTALALPDEVPGELAAIVCKAMAHDRDKRYSDASALAEDMRRFLAGQLVAAHRYTLRELVVRWLRRHRLAVAIAAIAVVILAGFAVVTFRRVVDERDRADLATAEQKARADELVVERADALVTQDPTAALALLKQLDPGSAAWQRVLPIAQTAQAFGTAWGREIPDFRRTDGRPVRLLTSEDDSQVVLLSQSAISIVDPSLRTPPRELAKLELSDGKIATWIGETSAIAVVDDRGGLHRIDTRTGAVRRLDPGGAVATLMAATDNVLVAVVDAGARVNVVDQAGGPPRALATVPDRVRWVRRQPGYLVYTTDNAIWYHRDGAAAQRVRDRPVGEIAAARDGKPQRALFFEINSARQTMLTLVGGEIAELSIDGEHVVETNRWTGLPAQGIAYAGLNPIAIDSAGVFWLNEKGTSSRDRHASLYATLGDESFLMTSAQSALILSMPGSLRVFQHGRSMDLGGRVEAQAALAFSNEYVLGVSYSGLMRSWRVLDVLPTLVVDEEGGRPIGWNGDHIWFRTRDRTLVQSTLNRQTGELIHGADFGNSRRLCSGASREVLATVEPPVRYEILDLVHRTRIGLPAETTGVACSSDANIVAIRSAGRLQLIDYRSGERRRQIALGDGRPVQVAVEAHWLVQVDDRGRLHRLDLDSDRRSEVSVGNVDGLEVEGTGRVTFVRGGVVTMWSGDQAPVVVQHLRNITFMAPTRAGLLITTRDHAVALVDHAGRVRSYQTGSRSSPALSRGEPFVVMTGLDQNLAVLDLETGSIRRLPWWAEVVEPSPDGQSVFGVFGDVGLISRSTVPRDIPGLQAWVRDATNATLPPGSTRLDYP